MCFLGELGKECGILRAMDEQYRHGCYERGVDDGVVEEIGFKG
jgi:hypothetical protein